MHPLFALHHLHLIFVPPGGIFHHFCISFIVFHTPSLVPSCLGTAGWGVGQGSGGICAWWVGGEREAHPLSICCKLALSSRGWAAAGLILGRAGLGSRRAGLALFSLLFSLPLAGQTLLAACIPSTPPQQHMPSCLPPQGRAGWAVLEWLVGTGLTTCPTCHTSPERRHDLTLPLPACLLYTLCTHAFVPHAHLTFALCALFFFFCWVVAGLLLGWFVLSHGLGQATGETVTQCLSLPACNPFLPSRLSSYLSSLSPCLSPMSSLPSPPHCLPFLGCAVGHVSYHLSSHMRHVFASHTCTRTFTSCACAFSFPQLPLHAPAHACFLNHFTPHLRRFLMTTRTEQTRSPYPPPPPIGQWEGESSVGQSDLCCCPMQNNLPSTHSYWCWPASQSLMFL